MSNTIKAPGQVWWAIHPWSERIDYLFKDGRAISTPAMFKGEYPRFVKMPFKYRPAIILAPGDENYHGYLVCYLSSHRNNGDRIPRRRLGPMKLGAISNANLDTPKDSYMFCTAPCYCPEEFFGSKPLFDQIYPGMFDLLESYLMRACCLAQNQKWHRISLDEMLPPDSYAPLEPVREAVRELISLLCTIKPANEDRVKSCPDKLGDASPDAEFDGVI